MTIGAAALALATIALVIVTPLAMGHLREAPVAPPPTVRLTITAPAGTTLFASFPVVSPDGRLVVFHAGPPGQLRRLWVRALDSLEARELPGAETTSLPYWSPDSRVVAFHAGDTIRTVDVASGLVRTVAGAKTAGGTGSWSPRRHHHLHQL